MDRRLLREWQKRDRILIGRCNGGIDGQNVTFYSNNRTVPAKCFGYVPKGDAIALQDENGEWWVYASTQVSQPGKFRKQIQYRKIEKSKQNRCEIRDKKALVNGKREIINGETYIYETTLTLIDCLLNAGFRSEDIILADDYTFSQAQNGEIDLSQFSVYTCPYSFYRFSNNLHNFALQDECLVKIILNESLSGLERLDFNRIEHHEAFLLGETYGLLTVGTYVYELSDVDRLFGEGSYEVVSNYRTRQDRFWVFYDASNRLFNINDDTSGRFYSLSPQEILTEELPLVNPSQPLDFYLGFLPEINSFFRKVFLCEWCEENPFV